MSKNEQNRRVAFVTGATSGLGLAISRELSSADYVVYGGGRRKPTESCGKNCQYVALDVTREASVVQARDFVLSHEDHIDLLVCAAGYGVSGAIEETPIEEARAQFDVNYFGVVRTVNAVLPGMRARRAGKIIIIGSVAGKIGMPFQAHYSASKFAIEGFVESLRYEVSPFGIEVCVVEPGDFKTGFTEARKKILSDGSPYQQKFQAVLSIQEHDETHGVDPAVAAKKIGSLAQATRKLRARYTVGPLFERFAVWVRGIMPDSWFEAFYRIYYKL